MDAFFNDYTPAQYRVQSRHAAKAVGVLRALHRTMTLQLAWTYLNVVVEEGLTVTALAARCGVDKTVMSRHLQDLGPVNRHTKQGLGLVVLSHKDLNDLRIRRVTLSDLGVTTAKRIAAILKDTPKLPTHIL